ncbi:hypothetical protein ABGB18_13365 [Nonomuraea sp. B12E4]|uniref:hypothetical protein n=1 Tax=Nonomuraea sp. B12E4 TaxID=3153564 RepID=UPI00325D677F
MRIRVVAGAALGAVLVAAPGATATVPAQLSGAAVYASAANQLSRYTAGEWATLARTGNLPQFAASPDGRKAAWVTSDGWLQVRQEGKTLTLVSGIQGGTPCLTPVWSPNSERVAYGGGGNTVMSVRADGTGAPHKLGTTEGICHLAWAANGRYLAGYTGEADGLYRLDTTTGKAVRVKGVDLVTHVQSVSPDGRKAVVEFPRNPDALGDGGWPAWFKPVVVDMVTGKRYTPQVKGRLLGASYLADGRLVVRVAGQENNTLVVLDEAGQEVQRIAEPSKARKQALLQVLS